VLTLQDTQPSQQLRTVLLDGRNFDAGGDDGTASNWEARTVSSGQWPPNGPLRILIRGRLRLSFCQDSVDTGLWIGRWPRCAGPRGVASAGYSGPEYSLFTVHRYARLAPMIPSATTLLLAFGLFSRSVDPAGFVVPTDALFVGSSPRRDGFGGRNVSLRLDWQLNRSFLQEVLCTRVIANAITCTRAFYGRSGFL
jgi:hypothetical protein